LLLAIGNTLDLHPDVPKQVNNPQSRRPNVLYKRFSVGTVAAARTVRRNLTGSRCQRNQSSAPWVGPPKAARQIKSLAKRCSRLLKTAFKWVLSAGIEHRNVDPAAHRRQNLAVRNRVIADVARVAKDRVRPTSRLAPFTWMPCPE